MTIGVTWLRPRATTCLRPCVIARILGAMAKKPVRQFRFSMLADTALLAVAEFTGQTRTAVLERLITNEAIRVAGLQDAVRHIIPGDPDPEAEEMAKEARLAKKVARGQRKE